MQVVEIHGVTLMMNTTKGWVEVELTTYKYRIGCFKLSLVTYVVKVAKASDDVFLIHSIIFSSDILQ